MTIESPAIRLIATLPVIYMQHQLPITHIIPDIKAKLATGNTLIVTAPPGAGKSTLLPLELLNEPWLEGQKIIMLEPRRLAARTIAARISSLLGSELGHDVGYRIRFENRTTKHTRLEVVTEGILTRMLQSDNALEGVGMVIFDEFHERSIHADVALALCREAQQVLRPDLRIVVMSATLNMPVLSSLLNAPVVESQGKQYPVDVIYGTRCDEWMIPEMTARVTIEASRNHQGDILVFLPGEGEIRKCEEILKKQLTHFAIHPLYGQLSPSKQQSAIMPNRDGKRKVVLATSIAETSLTIEGIAVVVDCGYGRTLRFDTRNGLSRLTTIEISKDSADQRAGRAGRLGPGTCYRLWSMADHHRMADHRTPEILESDLSSLVLDMAQWGVADVNRLAWLTPPPKSALSQASELLHEIDALVNHKITDHGKQLHRLPCHPRIAHMRERPPVAIGCRCGRHPRRARPVATRYRYRHQPASGSAAPLPKNRSARPIVESHRKGGSQLSPNVQDRPRQWPGKSLRNRTGVGARISRANCLCPSGQQRPLSAFEWRNGHSRTQRQSGTRTLVGGGASGCPRWLGQDIHGLSP